MKNTFLATVLALLSNLIIIQSIAQNFQQLPIKYEQGRLGMTDNLQGLERHNLLVEDLNNDGFPEILGSSLYSDSMQLYVNMGNGEFYRDSTINLVGIREAFFKAVHLNGDSLMDVVICGDVGGAFSVYKMFNNGGLNFSIQYDSVLNLSLDRMIVDAADVDGDGDWDLAVQAQAFFNNPPAINKLFFNDGNGVFVEDSVNNLGSLKGGLAFIQANGDSFPDIMVNGVNSNFTSASFFTRLYINDGTGIYSIDTINTFTPIQWGYPIAADMDLDGDDDIVFQKGDFATNSDLVYYENVGQGQFTQVNTGITGVAYGVKTNLKDFTGDGLIDIVIKSNTGNKGIEIYENLGMSSFQKLDICAKVQTDEAYMIELADLNADGNTEVLIQRWKNQPSRARFEIYERDSNDLVEVRSQLIDHTVYGEGKFSDIDQDNDLDIILVGSNNGYHNDNVISIYKNDGNASFRRSCPPDFPADLSGVRFELGDLDGDGDEDLVFTSCYWDTPTNTNNSLAQILLNDGTGEFTHDTTNNLVNVCAGDVELGDIDSDGDIDIIITGTISYSSSTRITSVYRNNGAGLFTNISQAQLLGVSDGAVRLADLDGDLDLDLGITGSAGTSVNHRFYKNDGSGNFSSPFNFFNTSVSSVAGDMVLPDLNNDSLPDVVMVGRNSWGNVSFIRENLGNWQFATNIGNPFNYKFSRIVACDLDNDNDSDLVAIGRKNAPLGFTQYLSVSYNMQTGTNMPLAFGLIDPQLNSFVGVSDGSIDVGDIDSDGDKDLLITGQDSMNIPFSMIYENLLIDCDAVTLSAVVSNSSCPGIPDGSISLTVSGTAGPYSVLWDTGDTIQQISSLSHGVYTVTVTDSVNCQPTLSVMVEAPEVSILLDSTLSCYGDQNAVVSATQLNFPNSSNLPNLIWNTGDTGNTLSGLAPGLYYVSTSINNCVLTDSIIISDPPELIAQISTLNSVSCFGYSDGELGLNISGGVPNYIWSWSTGSSQLVIDSLLPGLYTAYAQDQNGCIDSVSTTLTSPTALQNAINELSSILCFGTSMGSLGAQTSGGTPPYTYIWNTLDSQATIQGIPAGMYTVTVTDTNNCIDSTSYFLDQIGAIQLNFAVNQGINCADDSNGVLLVIANGGTPPYSSFLWNTGSNGVIASGLSEGTYSITVTDFNGCQFTDSTYLAAFYQTPSPDLGNDTSILVQSTIGLTSGITYPNSFVWSTGDTSSAISLLITSDTLVWIEVTSQFGCIGTDTIEIVALDSILGLYDFNSEQFVIYPNPTSRHLNISSDQFTTGQNIFRVFTIQGKTVLQKEIFIESSETTIRLDVSQLSLGNYFLEMTTPKKKHSVVKFIVR